LTWDEKVFFKHEIKVIAYDEDGLTDIDSTKKSDLLEQNNFFTSKNIYSTKSIIISCY